MEHSPECLSRQALTKAETDKALAELAEYEAAHPNYCRTCNGAGVTCYAWSYEDGDGGCEPCGCVEDGQCPVCAGPVDMVSNSDGDHFVCLDKVCGWNDMNYQDFTAPMPIYGPDDCECFTFDEYNKEADVDFEKYDYAKDDENYDMMRDRAMKDRRY